MTNRIIDFSELPARLRVRLKQLVVQQKDTPDVSMPLADLAVVIVSHPQVSYTQAVLSGLAEAGGSFVACNRQCLPVGMFLPLVGHHSQTGRFAAQATAALPVKKRLWRQIVRAKIDAQAETLRQLYGADHGIAALGNIVQSGDPKNVEARAARKYWPLLFADLDFRRHRENEDQNLLLNYGYAVLRAIVARAICAAGLHPSLGVHHHNHMNAFCLADDLMEPLRPLVDRSVVEYMATHDDFDHLERAAKHHLLSDLTGRYLVGGEHRTLFDVAARAACSLAEVYLGNAKRLDLTPPQPLTF